MRFLSTRFFRVKPTAANAQPLPYRVGDISCTGLLFRPPGEPGSRPGILLLHGGAGLDAHARRQGRRYADLGYVVFAADLYGDGVAGDRQRIMAQLTALRDDPELLAERGRSALAVLAGASGPAGVHATIGFCFGGLAALTLARSGAALAGAVSVHGTLAAPAPATPAPAGPGSISARVLVCHGALDPHVPVAQVKRFATEMERAGADWQLNVYGGAEHGFTHEGAAPGAGTGVSYHATADARSHADIRAFLADVLAV
ncbi:dienelactone hydrolase family protein [Cryptosporangium sp. NPDC051539]|uniref:dienelactone hydrolase family protein n=1 Tax=Cryptosporangium sp. NPDC051539 TaxID=3363962 RepID=UPI0037904FC5